MQAIHHTHHQGAIWALIYWVEAHLHIQQHGMPSKASFQMRKVHNEFLDDVNFFKDDEEFDAYMRDLG